MSDEKKYEFLLEISYKSGYSFKMWFTDFSIKGPNYSWTNAGDGTVRVLQLNAEEIVSVIQLDAREVE